MSNKSKKNVIKILIVVTLVTIVIILLIPSILNYVEGSRKKTFKDFIDKTYLAAKNKYMSDSANLSEDKKACTLYDVSKDLGLTSKNTYNGFVLITTDTSTNSPIIIITLESDNHALYGFIYNEEEVKKNDEEVLLKEIDTSTNYFKTYSKEEIKELKKRVVSYYNCLPEEKIDEFIEEVSKPDEEVTTDSITTSISKVDESTTSTTTNQTTSTTTTTVPTTKPGRKTDATYSNVDEMKNAKISEGKVVFTKGYYNQNDGGSGYYNIVKTAKYKADDGRVIKLNNGLFAVLENADDTIMSVKQYGVKGDASSKDSTQMNALINAGYKSIYFPSGTYNMSNYLCKPNRYIEIIGDGKNKTILKNISFEIKYGIKLEKATFEGAQKFGFESLTNQEILVRLFLKDNTNNVTYNNCLFKNMDLVSALKVDGTYSLKYDHVTNCDFLNIRRACIFHSANIGESIYTGNTFTDIGSKSINRNFVSCIWLGDVTNVTYTESNKVTIKNNTFNHFMTADDPSMAKHVINGNVIAIRANTALIDNNRVSNVDGIGEDREAVYSKVKYLTVSNNTIVNGGYGEGYITCKNQDGLDAYATITGNTITGDYGVGIYNYGSGLIKNNTIDIKHAKGAITCHYRDATSKTLTIESNIIKLGAGSYQYNGSAIPDYGPGNIIVISGQRGNVFVKNNKINLTQTGEKFSVGIDVSMLRENATITGNTIEGASALSTGMMIHANDSTTDDCRDSVVKVSDNSIKGITGTGISFFFSDKSGIVATRRFEISNNIIYTSSNYGVYVQDSTTADDTLIYTASNDSSSNNRVRAVNVKHITDNSGLVVQG